MQCRYDVTADIIRKQQRFVRIENLDNSLYTRTESKVVRPVVYQGIHPISVGWVTLYTNWCELIFILCVRAVQSLQYRMKTVRTFFMPVINNWKIKHNEQMKTIKKPIDYQLDYMERLFFKLKFKKTESYVIHRIWDKLDDSRIRFETQQTVNLPDGKTALADLYLPQLGIFVEVNEPYHEGQTVADNIRNQHIKDVTGNSLYIIQCGIPGKPGEWKTLHDIHEQIDTLVQVIKEKIAATQDLKPWNTSECLTPEYHKQKGILHIDDGLRTIDDICAIFDTQPKHRGFLRMGATPIPGKEKLDIWYPIENNGKGWINEREDGDDTIIEYHLDDTRRGIHVAKLIEENKQRVTFFRSEDELGITLYRFLGIYQLDIPASKENGKCIWRRASKEYKL